MSGIYFNKLEKIVDCPC